MPTKQMEISTYTQANGNKQTHKQMEISTQINKTHTHKQMEISTQINKHIFTSKPESSHICTHESKHKDTHFNTQTNE